MCIIWALGYFGSDGFERIIHDMERQNLFDCFTTGMRQNSHMFNLVEMFCHMIRLGSAIGDIDPWKMSWTTSLPFLLLSLFMDYKSPFSWSYQVLFNVTDFKILNLCRLLSLGGCWGYGRSRYEIEPSVAQFFFGWFR